MARLVGAPPAIAEREGGQLTEGALLPASVALLDEVEKSVHPAVFDILLQVLDDRRFSARTIHRPHPVSAFNGSLHGAGPLPGKREYGEWRDRGGSSKLEPERRMIFGLSAPVNVERSHV